jgi:hypothetical protein
VPKHVGLVEKGNPEIPIIRTGHTYIKHMSTCPDPIFQCVTPQSIRLS